MRTAVQELPHGVRVSPSMRDSTFGNVSSVDFEEQLAVVWSLVQESAARLDPFDNTGSRTLRLRTLSDGPSLPNVEHV
eukprot:399126-Amphidinium_carterae.1